MGGYPAAGRAVERRSGGRNPALGHLLDEQVAYYRRFEIGGTRGTGCQPGSPRRDPARSECATASRPSKAAHGRIRRPGPPPWRWQADWRGSKETGARPGRAEGEPLSAITAGCMSVLGGHAHPRPGDHLRVIGYPAGCPESAARPGTTAQRPAPGGRGGCAALAAPRAPGHEPHDDEDRHRDQPDDEKRLERGHEPARSRDGKPDGEDRAEDCPDYPAHAPSMPPGLAGSEPRRDHCLAFPAAALRRVVVHGTIAARVAGAAR